MNEYIKSMIQRGNIFAGRIINDNGVIIFQRIKDINELETLDNSEIAYATQSMGRAIFQIDDNGKVTNIKGVDSHLENDEIGMKKLVGANAMYITNDGKNYQESTFPINLIVFPGNRADIRIRGASPLEDLEIEADINSKMKEMDIKLPNIKSIKEFTNEESKRLGLPIKIDGSYDDLETDYREENDERKKRLHLIFGERFSEDVPEGHRAEKIGEYFERMGVFDSKEFQEFAQKNGFNIGDFIEYVDRVYSMGQRYGQVERDVVTPFRISDLEYYVQIGDMQSIQDIVEFENQIQCCMEFESEFSLQMGGNIAKLMNAGWCCENFVHRQDYTLAGEMCDDSYFDLQEHIRGVKDKCKDDTGKANAIVGDLKRTFFTQVFLIGSNIKVLQDEMKLRGKNSNLLDIYVEAFANNIDFNKISLKLGIDEKQVKIEFDKLLNGEHEYSKEMAAKSRPGGMIYDEEILFAHKDNNDFYNLLANKLAITLGLSKEQMAAQKLALFSERDVGKATINRQTIRKDNAQNRTQKDSSEIIHTKEQSINIE